MSVDSSGSNSKVEWLNTFGSKLRELTRRTKDLYDFVRRIRVTVGSKEGVHPRYPRYPKCGREVVGAMMTSRSVVGEDGDVYYHPNAVTVYCRFGDCNYDERVADLMNPPGKRWDERVSNRIIERCCGGDLEVEKKIIKDVNRWMAAQEIGVD